MPVPVLFRIDSNRDRDADRDEEASSSIGKNSKEISPRDLEDLGGLFKFVTKSLPTAADDDEKTAKEKSQDKLKPRVEWLETSEKHTIRVELPGVEKESMKVQLLGDSVKVVAERHDEPVVPKDDAAAKLRINETRYGTFARVFKFSAKTKLDDIKSVFRNGMLTITVPKEQDVVQELQIDFA